MNFATDYLTLNILLIVLSFFLLIKGSDLFVDSAYFIARIFNISEIVIGLTIVSIGTSLPELGTNLYASFVGEGAISLGNVVGSNIANICLVLGIGGIVAGKISVDKSVLKRDGTLMLSIFFLLYFLIFLNYGYPAGYLGRADGLIFILILVYYIYILLKSIYRKRYTEIEEQHCKQFSNIFSAIIFLIIGLILIFCGAKLLVNNVVWAAVKLDIPREIIASTVVAFGTSVPELAVTLTGAVKGRHDIAVGNVIGSCIFNIALVLGLSLIIRPVHVENNMIFPIIPMMILSGIATLALTWKSRTVTRTKGGILFLLYISFIIYNVCQVL
ncbi:MAG: calcium/sodium antiporter [Victivallales bacterium]|nr:calcium/sodium antiporter [Victivallales bacterium]